MKEASDTYEEFRRNYEYGDGEEKLKPWALLTDREKLTWEEQWRQYTGEIDTTGGSLQHGAIKHGDPYVTQLRKPRA